MQPSFIAAGGAPLAGSASANRLRGRSVRNSERRGCTWRGSLSHKPRATLTTPLDADAEAGSDVRGTHGAAPVLTDNALNSLLSRAEESSGNELRRRVAVLGSTGSIGTQTLDIVRESGGRFTVSALAANSNVELLVAQCKEFRPAMVCVRDGKKYTELKEKLREAGMADVQVEVGMGGVVSCAAESDAETVVTGIVGCAGLLPTVAAIRAGKDIALANKETLIAGGPVVVPLVEECGVCMTPADSEHSAIFQCLQGAPKGALKRVVLTASGGAFRDWKKERLEHVTLEDALKHPNWSMGAKSKCEAVWAFLCQD